jgi:hypothetical protein
MYILIFYVAHHETALRVTNLYIFCKKVIPLCVGNRHLLTCEIPPATIFPSILQDGPDK